MLTSIVKTVFSGLKSFLREIGKPGIIDQARAGRATAMLEQHRKNMRIEKLKNQAKHKRKGRRNR